MVFHSILHHHEENVGTLSDFLCEISHTANRLRLTGPREREALRQASLESSQGPWTAHISIIRPTRPPMRAKASAITASRPLRYWRFSSLVNLVGLVGVHRHVMQALRNLRLDIVIITVCSPTRKRRTKTSALSFMAVSIMCFLRPYSVLMEHRDEPPVCWSAVVSSASQNRLARLGMVAPSLGTSTVPGLLFSPSVQPSAPNPGRHLVNAPGLSLARRLLQLHPARQS